MSHQRADSLTEDTTVLPAVHDVLIIGAGPCGLAVAARLREATPSALFTDEEHQRYHWIRRHGHQASILNRKSRATSSPKQGCGCASILVLDDTSNQWMGRWHALFKKFEIKNLRSPMFFHPDPSDRDGLLAYMHRQGREKEMEEIRECVGKEISKHKRKKRTKCQHKGPHANLEVDERDRNDYFTPSQASFKDFCNDMITRYQLESEKHILREQVLDIDFSIVKHVSDGSRSFTVHTNQGVHYARTIVLAVGSGNPPAVPESQLHERIQGACHALQIQQFPDPSLVEKMKLGKQTNVVVVGGGLTSAQIADLCIRQGVNKVYHIMRSGLKVKPFDIDLRWMGKFRNLDKSVFFSADNDEERLEMIRIARNGGSINPPFHNITKKHIKKGALSLHTHTSIVSRTYNDDTKSWSIICDPPIADLPPIDYIYYATGVVPDVERLPYLQTMLRKHPIKTLGGLPCITDEMMWSEDVPLFLTGRLASMQLGPGGGNLEGARVGAERVVWSIQEVLGRGEDPVVGALQDDGNDWELWSHDYRTGKGSRFVSLAADNVE